MLSRILLAIALCLAGCATFTDAELAQIRQRGLRPELVAKLEHRGSLNPDEIIELKRAGLPDEQVVRHLEKVGVNYVVTRSDISQLRKARVSPRVIDSLLNASELFAARLSYRSSDDGWYYNDPWGSSFYGDWQIGYGISTRGGHHDHGGHRHH